MHRFDKDHKPVTLAVCDSLIADVGTREVIEPQGVLREIPHRRYVWRGRWRDTLVVVKYYPKHPGHRRHCSREWDKLKQLWQLGLSVPQPLFIGAGEAEGSKGLALVTRWLTDTQSVKDALAQARDARQRVRVLEHLFRHIAEQHQRGVWQRDNHLDNYLWDGEQAYALDAASFRFSNRPLSPQQRIANLALLFANIDLPYSAEAQEACSIYQRHASKKGQAIDHPLSRPRVGCRHRRSRLRQYQKKTIRSCTAFAKTVERDQILWCDRQLPTATQRQLLQQPDQLIANGRILKNGNTCTVVAVTLGGYTYILKRYQRKPLLYQIRHVLLGSRARHSWTQMLAARLFGLLVPQPRACLEERRGPLVTRAFLLMDKVPGIPIDQWVARHQQDAASLRRLGETFAGLWSGLGALRARHGDMKASNLLVDDSSEITLIDFDHAAFFLPPGLYCYYRRKDWRRFMKNWQNHPAVAAIFHESVDKA